MRATRSNKMKFNLNGPISYLIAIVLGLAVGLADVPMLQSVGLTIADIFIRIFRCISLPIICLSIIVTLSNYRSSNHLKNVWRKTITYTVSTTLIAATISFLLYNIIKPNMIGEIHKATNFNTQAQHSGYLEHLTTLIPDNLLTPFLNGSVISVLFLSIIISIAIRFIPDAKPRETITQFFQGAHGLFMVITKWIITIIPIGMFGFITSTVINLKSGADIKGIGQYLSVIVLANIIQGLIILPAWLMCKGIHPYKTLQKMLPALSLAFFSKSSIGSLPITINTVEENLNVRPEVSRFVLPLCTSINMNGCAAFIFTTVVYLLQNNGVELSLGSMSLWIVIATVAAIGNAGVPMGCFFLSASLLANMHVQITLLGIILPFYSLIDMLETALNVWSDSCVVKVVNDETSATDLVTDDIQVEEAL